MSVNTYSHVCMQTHLYTRAHTRAAWRPTVWQGLHYWWRWLINLWKWLSHMADLFFPHLTQLLSAPLPPRRNNRSITAFCHLTEREKWGSDWKGLPPSWCCVSGLSVRRETLMDCRAESASHTHAKSLQGDETLPCCLSEEGTGQCCWLLGFVSIKTPIITGYAENTVEEDGRPVCNCSSTSPSSPLTLSRCAVPLPKCMMVSLKLGSLNCGKLFPWMVFTWMCLCLHVNLNTSVCAWVCLHGINEIIMV